MLTQENGLSGATSGVVTRVLSSGTINVQYDGSSYPGNLGHDVRISICGGAQCGATVSTADWLVVHKVSLLSDTDLPATLLSTDPSWTGVQTGGTVALFSRGGRLPLSAGLQTSHAGTAQYLIAGLEAGHTYQARRLDDGVVVATLPVAAGDNTLYFEATAGSYSIFPSGLANLFLGPRPPLRTRQQMQYDFKVAGDPDSYIWTVSSGSLPPGLMLSSNGILSGAPTQKGSYQATISAQESGGAQSSASVTITLSVTDPPMPVTAAGGVGRGYLSYGNAALNALQSCSIVVSTQPDFSTIAESQTDAGGAAIRQAVAGVSTPLADNTLYYVRVVCGGLQGTSQFLTAKTGSSRPISFAVSVSPPPALAVTGVQIQYGATPQLGGSITNACQQHCMVSIPAMSQSIIFWKRLYLDAHSRVLAQSSVAPLLVPF